MNDAEGGYRAAAHPAYPVYPTAPPLYEVTRSRRMGALSASIGFLGRFSRAYCGGSMLGVALSSASGSVLGMAVGMCLFIAGAVLDFRALRTDVNLTVSETSKPEQFLRSWTRGINTVMAAVSVPYLSATFGSLDATLAFSGLAIALVTDTVEHHQQTGLTTTLTIGGAHYIAAPATNLPPSSLSSFTSFNAETSLPRSGLEHKAGAPERGEVEKNSGSSLFELTFRPSYKGSKLSHPLMPAVSRQTSHCRAFQQRAIRGVTNGGR